MARYGVPYMGSKNSIAEEVVATLPPARRFYDLFAGGCAITHCAMESGKYQEFYCNDIDFRGVTLFRDAIAGKYKDERRVITREDFFRLKDTDPYVALCWSFGNRADTYLWGADKEAVKIPACRMLTAETLRERRLAYMDFIYTLREHLSQIDNRPDLESLESLESLQRLQRLERLQSLQSLHIDPVVTIGNYYDVNILPDSIVYCDPPYKDTQKYDAQKQGEAFDYDRFYDWLRSTPFPVYVSEYSMPEDFVSIWHTEKRSLLSAQNKSLRATEHLYLHHRWLDQHPRQPQQLTLF